MIRHWGHVPAAQKTASPGWAGEAVNTVCAIGRKSVALIRRQAKLLFQSHLKRDVFGLVRDFRVQLGLLCIAKFL